MRPTVSVVLCTWNRCDVLRAAIDALIHQDKPVAYEVVLVDNGSTDRTAQVAAEAERRAGGLLTCVYEPRPGLSHARNSGVRAARGELIAFTDDDVRVSPCWIRTIATTFDAHPEADWIGGPVLPQWPSPPPAWLDRQRWAPVGLQDHGGDAFIVGAGRPICLIGANLAVRRHAFDLVGAFDPTVQRVGDGTGSTEDHEFQRRLWRRGRVGLYAPDLVVRAAVDQRRLDRRYHYDWHRGHGRHLARMRDPALEAIGGRRIAGVPMHLLPPAFRDPDARAFARGFVEERLRDRRLAPAVEKGLASVVIPCFNHGRYLAESIESALAQRREVEVIVVDDGSSDDSWIVAGRFPNVQLLRQRNRGLSRARNTGLAAASGEFVLFLDADDRLLPGALDALQRALVDETAAAFAYGGFHDIDEGGRTLDSRPPLRRAPEIFDALLRSNFICVPGAVLFRTEPVRQAGGFRTGIEAAADYDLYLQLARKHPAIAVGREVIEYRRHASNMSNDAALMLRATLRAHKWHRTATLGGAYAEGRRYWKEFYGAQLLEQVRRDWRDGRFVRAIRGMLWLGVVARPVARAALGRIRHRGQTLRSRKA